jgi:ribosomal protein L11 methyltransferase
MIDWDALWAIHSPHYKNGLVRLPLENGEEALLKPGPSFGDLSHSTTNLLLSHLNERLLKGKVVLDIGTGSGVLAIVAALLGAKKTFSFEIDPPSILHAIENIELNNLNNSVFINKTPSLEPEIVFMNMISSEQETALKEHPYLNKISYTLITSGVLTEEKEIYLSKHKERTLIKSAECGIWSSFMFSIER